MWAWWTQAASSRNLKFGWKRKRKQILGEWNGLHQIWKRETVPCAWHLWTAFLARERISLGSIERNKVEKLCSMPLFLITIRFFWRHTKRPVSLHGCKAVLEANVKTLCPGTTQCLLFTYFFLGNRAEKGVFAPHPKRRTKTRTVGKTLLIKDSKCSLTSSQPSWKVGFHAVTSSEMGCAWWCHHFGAKGLKIQCFPPVSLLFQQCL